MFIRVYYEIMEKSDDKHYRSAALITDYIRDIVDRMGDPAKAVCLIDGRTLIVYDVDNPLDKNCIKEHFKHVENIAGIVANELNCKLAVSLVLPITENTVIPNSLSKTCDEEKGEALDGTDDEWAEVRRIRDLNAK